MAEKENEIQDIGMILLRIGSMLQSSGACTARIRIILERIARAYDMNANALITHRAIILTLLNQQEEPVFNSVKRTASVGVNFKIVSGISLMSLNIKNSKWQLVNIIKELDKLENAPHYHRFIVMNAVSLAGAGFCFLAEGSLFSMSVCFIATFLGLFVKQETTRIHLNPYLCVFLGAFTATFIAGAFRCFFPEADLEHAFATSVLFLIPGVPLINSFIDFIDGNLLNGIIRLINGLGISFMIAIGMICSIVIFNL
ncbi:threonine/serine exporter family protein [Aestuariibaculum lutulentum]|uniref:Threonine/serine exporter family protein n=2 Tax=Aestuariibaculum lutulentum TaxID=2920935 RepID=A0ABS9RIW9_9FLAO|nr:threonine/serine exporter family protein [Aestuariibaculum lutulentum]MCH4552902.1 threonine/serine exporter family protein [Aestuariibaculum lutulentum]